MKIVFTGPECSGKTTLALILGQHLHIPVVKEIAREYLSNINRNYKYEDVLNIALLQMAEEERIKSISPQYLICDTDLLTIKIWCDDKFNKCEHWINEAFISRTPHLYFLCKPDFDWVHDPLREDENRRNEIYNQYKNHMIHFKLRFIELSGSIENRMEIVHGYFSENHLF